MLRYMKYTFYSWTFHVTYWTLFWTLFHCVRTNTIRISERFIPGSISETLVSSILHTQWNTLHWSFLSGVFFTEPFSVGLFLFCFFGRKFPMMCWPQDQIELKKFLWMIFRFKIFWRRFQVSWKSDKWECALPPILHQNGTGGEGEVALT